MFVCLFPRKEQRELTERLRVLKEEEQRLVRDGKTGTELQDQAASVHNTHTHTHTHTAL